MTAGPATRVVVVGGTGFIGSHVVRALAQDAAVTSTTRRAGATVEPGVRTVLADLDDPATLRSAFEGADVVVHAASYVGRDAALSETTNVRGTENLVAAAREAGVERIVALSTTSVYGTGPHRGISEDEVAAHPESVASEHRHAAERLVLDAGGTVLRPNLVYGAGDRWFVPALASVTAGLGATIEGGAASISVIAVEDLARIVATLSTSSAAASALSTSGTVLHASAPAPVTVRSIIDALVADLGVPEPARDLTAAQARGVLPAERVSDHQLALITQDHWYDSELVWSLVGEPPAEAFRLTDAHRAWYAAALR